MCGIFGAIGHSINPGTIRALALINRERGTDSLGFFSSSGKFVKRAADPVACLGDEDFANFIDKGCKGWLLAGHTRLATHGLVTTQNAHPFRYGRIIGAHNGVVSVPKGAKYRVDSEYLFDSLNKAEGNYQSAFANISGFWALSWFDGESFYLQAHNNEVAIGKDSKGVWYFSSDWQHLEAAVHIVDEFGLINGGDTIRFTLKTLKTGKFERLPIFVPSIRPTSKIAPCQLEWFDRESKKARRKHRRDSHAARTESAECNTDPFYFDDGEKWAGVDTWSEYVRDFI